jgi:hypothetical protein
VQPSKHGAQTPDRKPISNADLVRHLCSASSALREAQRMHLQHFGTLIPHVFMTDVLARVGFCVSPARGDTARTHTGEAAMILDVLERGLAEGERETRNVIAVSFVNDAELERFFAQLRPLLGPRLLGQLRGR